MSEIVVPLVNAVLTGLTVSFMTYVISKRMLKDAKASLKLELEAWLNSEKGQKALFSVGALIANGAKSGFNLNVPRGKGGFEGLIMNIIGKWIGEKIPQNSAGLNPAAESFKTEY